MTKVTMRVEGLSELVDSLQELPKATGKNVIKRILTARARPIEDDMRALVPVDWGDLRDSITVSTKLNPSQRKLARDTKSYTEVYVGPGPQRKIMVVEFGTSRMAARSFARPAWDKNKGLLLLNIAKDLWAEIQKAADKIAKKKAKSNG